MQASPYVDRNLHPSESKPSFTYVLNIGREVQRDLLPLGEMTASRVGCWEMSKTHTFSLSLSFPGNEKNPELFFQVTFTMMP